METTPHQEFRIAPQLRRCCWYTVAGAAVLGITFFGIARFIQNRGPVEIAVGCLMIAIMAASMAMPLSWKLRVSRDGLERRILFRWDKWRWDEFARGRICKLHPYTLLDRERPWWRRKLRLGYMDSADIQRVVAAINKHYQLPAPPCVSATLTIQYGFRHSVTFDRQGVQLMSPGRPRLYTWRELSEIHITRMDPIRRDFKSLLMAFPDQEIELKLITHQGGTSPSWRGATAEEINEFLFQNVPADHISVSIEGEPLTCPKQIAKKLKHFEKMNRDLGICLAIFTPLLVACLIWMAITDGIFQAVTMTVVCIVAVAPILVFVLRSQAQQIRDLKRTLASVNTDHS
ncbi:MAG: hypothetical protein MUC83_12060 [Pirellula sp.]|jgi:hypothetical protein|nr:hypothetical protein [Pirellula sp.]